MHFYIPSNRMNAYYIRVVRIARNTATTAQETRNQVIGTMTFVE